MDRYKLIWRAIQKHGYKYNYTKIHNDLINNKQTIICPIHGEFLQNMSSHINNGCGCKKCGRIICANKFKDSIENFIKKANKIHKNRYDYSKSIYINQMVKILIIDVKCGHEFWQRPLDHLNGNGCPICNKKKHTTLDFINKAKLVHGDKYDYSKVEYVNTKTKVCIICPIHGEFMQRPDSHLFGSGCPKCSINSISSKLKGKYHRKLITTNDFIEKAKLVHGDKYDYSKVEYIGAHTKICITCPTHGEFYQTPNNHLSGKGCFFCNLSHLEKKIAQILTDNKITFEQQKTFKWLKYKTNLYLDFYLPDYNVAIECQGVQHFEPIDFFGGIDGYEKIIKRDETKKRLCEENGVILIYIK